VFIDEEWLKELKPFRLPFVPDGASSPIEYKVTGLLGVDSFKVVSESKDSEGNDIAIRTLRESWSFASYNRELQPGMSFSDNENPESLCRKLDRLIGDPLVDIIVPEYDNLYRSLVDNLHGWPAFNEIEWKTDEATEVMSFTVQMPGTISKFEKLALASTSRAETAAWAKQTLDLLAGVDVDRLFQPEILHLNPLYIWGGAMLSGFFLDRVEAARCARFRLTARSKQLRTFVAQGRALAALLLQFQIDRRAAFAEFWETTCDGLEAD